jgi:pyrrolysine biosynthesis protein PylC
VRVAVIGGNLQGVEATYLAKKADWEVIVIDRKTVVPATGLCDQFIQHDICNTQDLENLFKDIDFVFPALENESALRFLNDFANAAGFPFAFDYNAYQISSSKLKSDRLFEQCGVPAPLPWPDCDFPVVAKPSGGSGSRAVAIVKNETDLNAYLSDPDHQWVLQEYIQGPSYSIEIIGRPGQYTPLQVTDLDMDAGYDCKRVLAPSELPQKLRSDFEKISKKIANALALNGLMDVEVIHHQNSPKVLEIDARFPSQTPTAVYWSTGLNMFEFMANLFLNKKNDPKGLEPAGEKGVIYEHINVSSQLIEVSGEHIMSGADGLYLEQDFFGADEAITNYGAGRDNWVATLIVSDTDRQTAWEKRNHVIANLKKHFRVDQVLDPAPPDQV